MESHLGGANGWGWSIAVGIGATLVSFVVGFGLLPPVTMKMDRMEVSTAGAVVTAEQDLTIQQLTSRATTLARINTAMLILVVVAMAIARFV